MKLSGDYEQFLRGEGPLRFGHVLIREAADVSKLGFLDFREFVFCISNARPNDEEEEVRFEIWRKVDGTKRGLLEAFPELQGLQRVGDISGDDFLVLEAGRLPTPPPAPTEVEGRKIVRVVRWVESGYCVVRDEVGLPLTCFITTPGEEDQGTGSWRFTGRSRELLHALKGRSPAEVRLVAIRELFAEAASLRRLNREAKSFYDECVRLGRNPGGRVYPPSSLAGEVELEAETALQKYLRGWAPDDPIPPGYMECDGVRPSGETGRHLRRGSREVDKLSDLRRDLLMSIRARLVPETLPGEEVIYQMASPVPIIILGRLHGRT